MISVISKNWKNPTFYPTIDQLREFKRKIEEVAYSATSIIYILNEFYYQ